MAYDIISEIGFGAPFGFVESGSDVGGLIQGFHDGLLPFGLMARLWPFTHWIKSTWVGEKYNEAAGPENQKKPYWTRVILTTATLYYFTDCIMPSMLCYYENVRHENFASFAMEPDNRITVPFGYTSFYWDTEPSSKRAVERTGNLVYYKGQ